MEKEVGVEEGVEPLREDAQRSPTGLKVGDSVRVLPIVVELYPINPQPRPGIIKEMLPMVGKTYKVTDIDEEFSWADVGGWYFKPEWLELVPPLETPEASGEAPADPGPSKEFLFAFNEGMKFQAGISSYQNEKEAWDAFQKGDV